MGRTKKSTKTKTDDKTIASENSDIILTLEPTVEDETVESVLDSLDDVVSPFEGIIHDYADSITEGGVTEEINDLIKETDVIADEVSNKIEEIVADVKESSDEIDDYFNKLSKKAEEVTDALTESTEQNVEEVTDALAENTEQNAESNNAGGDTIKIADADELKNAEENKVKKVKKVREKKVKEKKAKEKKTSNSAEEVKVEKLGFNWFFWINFIIIMIPCVYFVMLLLQASDKSNTPIIGDRIETDIQQQYTITEDNISQIKNSISSIEGVEKASVNLAVETLRITVDCRNDATVEDMKKIAEEAYNRVVAVLPVENYFTVYQSYKQYDLEINLYNDLEASDFRNVTLVKNSTMETYVISDLSTPLNPEFYDELIAEMNGENNDEPDDDNQNDDTVINDDDDVISDEDRN